MLVVPLYGTPILITRGMAETIMIFLRLPSPSLLNARTILRRQFDLTDKEPGGAARHREYSIAIRDEHDGRGDMGKHPFSPM